MEIDNDLIGHACGDGDLAAMAELADLLLARIKDRERITKGDSQAVSHGRAISYAVLCMNK